MLIFYLATDIAESLASNLLRSKLHRMTHEKANDIKIDRIWSMPNKNTFEIAPIRALLAEEVDPSNLWIDPFANRNKWASITNDLNPEYD